MIEEFKGPYIAYLLDQPEVYANGLDQNQAVYNLEQFCMYFEISYDSDRIWTRIQK
jgi:hypothetical protein